MNKPRYITQTVTVEVVHDSKAPNPLSKRDVIQTMREALNSHLPAESVRVGKIIDKAPVGAW